MTQKRSTVVRSSRVMDEGTNTPQLGRGRRHSGLALVSVSVTLMLACQGATDEASLLTLRAESVSNAAQSAHRAPFPERLEAALAALQRSRIRVIVALSHRGGPVLVREFGALRRDGIPPERTLVDLNSITKTLTAVVIAKLVERGKLQFNETLGGLLANVPADKSAITVHQLLTHTAGLPEFVGEDREVLDKEQFLARVFDAPLSAAPGTEYTYANTGYGVLAAIVEARSGKPYEEYLRQDVLPAFDGQIGYASAYDNERSLRTLHRQTIYRASWGNHEPSWNLIGNGGLVATATTMIRFRQALLAGAVISQGMLELVQSPHVREGAGASSFYGYGVVVSDVPGIGTIYSHDGGNDVFSAHWADFVDQGDIIFTAAADTAAGNATDSMQILASKLYGYEGGEED